MRPSADAFSFIAISFAVEDFAASWRSSRARRTFEGSEGISAVSVNSTSLSSEERTSSLIPAKAFSTSALARPSI